MRFNDGGEQFVLWTRWSPRLAHCLTVLSLSRVQLFATPWTVALQSPLSWGFSRQEYWSELPCPSLGDLPDPGIELGFLHCR